MGTIQNIRDFLTGERAVVRSITTTAADNITATAEVTGMLSVPLIPAALTALSLIFTIKEWDTWAATTLAIITVIALESLGIVASKTALRLYRAWQDELTLFRDFLAAVIATAAYAILVLIIIVGGHTLPEALIMIGAVSPFLAIATYVVIGLGIDLQERVDHKEQALDFERKIDNEIKIADLEDYKARLNLERELKREAHRAKLEAKYSKNSHPKLTPQQARTQARQILNDNPDISGAELGRLLGRSERNGQDILNELQEGQGHGHTKNLETSD